MLSKALPSRGSPSFSRLGKTAVEERQSGLGLVSLSVQVQR
jgi:hypothetical protein